MKKHVTEGGDLSLYPKWEEMFMLNFPSLCRGENLASQEAGLHQAHCTQNLLQQKISPLQTRLSLGINEFSSGFEC